MQVGFLRVGAAVLTLAWLAACEGAAVTPDGGAISDGGPDHPGVHPDGFAVADGASILVPVVKRIAFKSTGGGYGMPPPPGAACNGQVWTYTLDVGTGELTWSICDVGTRTLPAAQLDTAKAAVANVHVSAVRRCGADKPDWTLAVMSAAASLTYGDDFYSCFMTYQHFVVSGDLEDLHRTLLPLAH
jgi:hypothetical protein